jgi:hypothetical protein
MAKTELISWDRMSTGGPDPQQVADAIASMQATVDALRARGEDAAIHAYVIDEGTDDATVMLSHKPLTEAERADQLDIHTRPIPAHPYDRGGWWPRS